MIIIYSISKEMSQELEKYLERIYREISIQKKKKKYLIKDGIMSFEYDLFKPCKMCEKTKECSLKKCVHFYAVLQYLNIPFEQMMFIGINDNLHNIFNNNFTVHDSDMECVVCLDECWNSSMSINKVYQCLNCSKFLHTKCIARGKLTKCPMCHHKI